MTTGDRWQAPSAAGDGHQARQKPEDTAERRITWWQRALRWVAWLTFLGLAIWKSGSVYFSPIEWLAQADPPAWRVRVPNELGWCCSGRS